VSRALATSAARAAQQCQVDGGAGRSTGDAQQEACSSRKTERQPSGVNGQDCWYVCPHFRVRRVLPRRWTSRLLPRKGVDGESRDCRTPER
jgi:hypothetical protein